MSKADRYLGIGAELLTRIEFLANEVFGIDLTDYYRQLPDREFWGLAVDRKWRKLYRLFGEPTSRFLHIAGLRFPDSEAGFAVDIKARLAGVDADADVFMLSTERLDDEIRERDSLLCHELCHFVMDSHLVGSPGMVPDEEDKARGQVLYDRTDKAFEHRTKHTLDFCTVLAWAARRAVDRLPHLEDIDQFIDLAVRFDTIK